MGCDHGVARGDEDRVIRTVSDDSGRSGPSVGTVAGIVSNLGRGLITGGFVIAGVAVDQRGRRLEAGLGANAGAGSRVRKPGEGPRTQIEILGPVLWTIGRRRGPFSAPPIRVLLKIAPRRGRSALFPGPNPKRVSVSRGFLRGRIPARNRSGGRSQAFFQRGPALSGSPVGVTACPPPWSRTQCPCLGCRTPRAPSVGARRRVRQGSGHIHNAGRRISGV